MLLDLLALDILGEGTDHTGLSGQSSFTLVANEIIRKALSLLGVGSEGEAVTADMYARGMDSLNLLIKTWGTIEHLWAREQRTINLVGGQAAYPLNPKPLRVLSARRGLLSGGYETPMFMWSRSEYLDQPNKLTSPSTPVNFYYDAQRNSGVLHLWPAPSVQAAAQNIITVDVLRTLDDMINSNDGADFPQEWLQAIIWNLADDLQTEYPVNDPRLSAKIETKAAMLLGQLRGFDQETSSIYLQPDYHWRR